MWSSGTAARSRTAHLTLSARVGNSTTSGPASHSTTVSGPIGELYDVHSTRIRAFSRGQTVRAKGTAGSAREPLGPCASDSAHLYFGMTSPQTLVVRTFTDRAEGLSHFVLRAGEAPRLLAFDDALGCPVETALAALEWTGAVGILPDDDLLHAARLTSETAAAVIERKAPDGRRYVYLGPRLDAPPMDVFEGAILFDEPGVKAVEFTQRAHALAHFLRATAGAGALLALLGRRAPEVRHLRRWLGPIIQELDGPRPLVAGWFAASSAGCLFSSTDREITYRYIEVGLES